MKCELEFEGKISDSHGGEYEDDSLWDIVPWGLLQVDFTVNQPVWSGGVLSYQQQKGMEVMGEKDDFARK
jgi:hypothetical protein